MFFSDRELNKLTPYDREIIARYMQEVPVKLGSLAKELGIDVKLSSLPLNVSGQITRTENGYEIKINRHESRQRQRFTLAHEIAHYLLHRQIIDNFGGTLEDNVLYRSGAPMPIEYEANRLAAQIIMPKAMLEKYIQGNNYPDDEIIEDMAKKFGVSKAAMEVRIKP